MAKHLSGRQNRLNVGITSFTETQTVVQVTGKVAIGATDAAGYSLYVNGPTNIIGPTGFGTLTANNLFSNSGIITNLAGTNLNYSGIGTVNNFISTTANITNLSGDNLKFNSGIITTLQGTNIFYNGIGTIGSFIATNAFIQTLDANIIRSNSGIITTLQGTNIFYNGIGTIGSFISTNSFIQTLDTNIIRSNSGIITNLSGTNLNYTGVSTFTNGPLFVGTGTSTGTANQKLQVTSGAYVSGNLGIAVTNPFQPFQVGSGTTIVVVDNMGDVGIGTTNPIQKLHVLGNLLVAAGSSTAQYITQKPYELNGGTLSWEGSSGQLFSITNSLSSGSLFAVNDISGIPSLDVNANGTVSIAAYNGNVTIGSTSITGTASQQLQVNSGAYVSGSVGIGSTNPTSKLYVVGDALITGIVTSTTGGFRGQLTGVSNYTYIAGFSSVTGQAGVATISAVAGFATVASIAGYSSVTGTAGFSSFTSIAGFATITAVAGFATVATQAGVSTIASVAGFATVSTFAGVSTFANISSVAGFSTFASTSGFSTFSSTAGFSTFASTSGFSTFSSTAGFSTFASTSGFATVSTQSGISTSVIGGVVNVNALQITGVSTFTDGPVFIGISTVSQPLQVTGGAYIAGNLGIGSTNPSSKLYIVGDEYVTGVVTAIGGFSGQLTGVSNYTYIAGVSTIASIAGFSTVSAVSGFSTVASIAGFSTVAAVAGFATVSSQAGVSTLASYAYAAGIATVAIQAGFATNVIGGIGSVTSLTVGGISTLTSISAGGTTGTNQYVLTSTGLGLSWQAVTGIGAISGVNIASDIEDSAKYITFVNISSGTTASQYVSSSKLVFNPGQGHLGIGSTNPSVELSVIGDAIISGVVSATTFYGNFIGAVLSGSANYAFSAGFSTVSAIAGFSTVAAVAGFATVSTVAGVATFATLAGSAGFATVSTFAGVSTFANIASVAGFSTVASIAGFSTISAVAGFATVATQAGISTSVVGGVANVNSLNVSGITTLAFLNGTSANFTGIVTAVDGRLIAGVGIQSGGVAIGAGVTTLNFIGLGNTFLLRGSTIDISIQGGGGGGSLSISTSVVSQFQYIPFVSTASTSILGISNLARPLGFIPSTGNLGIGTINPQDKLEINSLNGTDVKLRLATNASTFNNFSVIRGVRISDFESRLEFQVNNSIGITTAVTIDPGGTVTFGEQATTQLIIRGNSRDQNNGPESFNSLLNIFSNTALAADAGGSISLGGIYNNTGIIDISSKAFGVIRGYKENATDSDTKGYLSFLINTGSSITEALRIVSSGNLGIGINNPTSKLTVQGDVLISGVTTSTGGFRGQLTGVSNYSYLAGFSSVTGTAGFSSYTSVAGFSTVSSVSGFSTYSSTSGFSSVTTQAGISTSVIGGVANITSLQVSGISTFSTGAVIIGTGQTSGFTSTTLQVVGVSSSAYIGGNVGIGTTDLSYRLNVNGDINSSGAIRVNGRNILDDAVIFAIALG
jgi:hypothetical protein